MNGREAMGRLAQRVKASMGRYRLGWLVILAGLILLPLPTGEKEGEARGETEQTQSAFDLAATEARLSQALSKIHGAGEVTAVPTVANGPRPIPAGNVDRDGFQGGGEKGSTRRAAGGAGGRGGKGGGGRRGGVGGGRKEKKKGGGGLPGAAAQISS